MAYVSVYGTCVLAEHLFFFKQAAFFLKKTNTQLNLQCIYCKETNICWEQTYSCLEKKHNGHHLC